MKRVRFDGVPHAPALVIPHAVPAGAPPNNTPWEPGEEREIGDDAAAERLLVDYAEAGSRKTPAFRLVETAKPSTPAKPAESGATK